jgi:chromosome partitioning protein
MRYNPVQENNNLSVICIANQKGGVGKTTTAVSLAGGLGEHGKNVLLVDWDPQGSLTIASGLKPEMLQYTGYDLLLNILDGGKGVTPKDVILETKNPKVHIMPANVELSQAQLDLVNAQNRELVLREILRPIRGNYDYVLIDCLPSLGLLTINALSASDSVIIPLQADFLAMKGLAQLLDTIIMVKEKINNGLKISGILFTMTNMRTLHSKEVIEVTRRAFGDKIRVFDTLIPITVRFKEAPAAGESILTYDSGSNGAEAYRQFTKEVMDEKS